MKIGICYTPIRKQINKFAVIIPENRTSQKSLITEFIRTRSLVTTSVQHQYCIYGPDMVWELGVQLEINIRVVCYYVFEYSLYAHAHRK